MRLKLLIRGFRLLGQLLKATNGKKTNQNHSVLITIAVMLMMPFFILTTAFGVVSNPGLLLQTNTLENKEKLIAEEDIGNAKLTKVNLIDNLLALIKSETGETATLEGVPTGPALK